MNCTYESMPMVQVIKNIVMDVIDRPIIINGIWNNTPRTKSNGSTSNRTFKILGVEATPDELKKLAAQYKEVYGDRFIKVKNSIAYSTVGAGRFAVEIPEPKLVVTFKF